MPAMTIVKITARTGLNPGPNGLRTNIKTKNGMRAIAKPTDHLPKEVCGKVVKGFSSRPVDAWRRRALATKTKKAMITTATNTIGIGFIVNKVPPLNRTSEALIKTIIPPAFSDLKLAVKSSRTFA